MLMISILSKGKSLEGERERDSGDNFDLRDPTKTTVPISLSLYLAFRVSYETEAIGTHDPLSGEEVTKV